MTARNDTDCDSEGSGNKVLQCAALVLLGGTGKCHVSLCNSSPSLNQVSDPGSHKYEARILTASSQRSVANTAMIHEKKCPLIFSINNEIVMLVLVVMLAQCADRALHDINSVGRKSCQQQFLCHLMKNMYI
jgi:hypothetical protein